MKKPPSPKASFKNRTAARLASVQALFQVEQSGASASAVTLEFLTHRRQDVESGVSKFDASFFTKLVEGAWKNHEQSDEMIGGALKAGWSIERIEPVTRAILRASLYELLETQTPSGVILDEYLNITRVFFNDSEVSFVNGILNTIAQKIRSSAPPLKTST
ncbi:MAG: transcription antitermination factor NusB [Alphaproteobacteria bacterium]|nr:transcription antitermination factor NusB [Alphaproteobacteria bacterium]